MKNKVGLMSLLMAGVILGSVVTIISYSIFLELPGERLEDIANQDKKIPLYWVAPMDPDYKRNRPGKSPMGMDLLPVYENSGTSMGVAPGVIKISPEVVNNLGVRTTTAQYKALRSQIKTVGYVQYDEDQLVHIHPRVEGWVEKLYVKAAGDPVKKGQPLYEIYSPALVNAQEELVLALDRKNIRLIQAAEDRLSALQLPKSVIKKLRKTRKVKQTITFFAPQSGVVDNLNIREGFFVKPGTTLMSIGKLDQVWVEAEVFERQAFQVSAGLPVTMTLDFLPGKRWQGKVDYVYPTLNAKTRTVKVRLRFSNESGELKPNMFAQVIIYAVGAEDSLLIPREAVIRTGNFDRVVLALGDGRFKSVEVKIGRFDETFVEILSGLNVGEKVVSSAQFLLDSESSKTSDFKRMSYQMLPQEEKKNSDNFATVTGVINNIMPNHRMLNISREPIKKWNRPAVTMDFTVSEEVNMSKLFQGMKIKFTFHINEGEFIVTEVQPQPANQLNDHKG